MRIKQIKIIIKIESLPDHPFRNATYAHAAAACEDPQTKNCLSLKPNEDLIKFAHINLCLEVDS